MRRIILCLILLLSLAGTQVEARDFAKRYPNDTSMEVYTPSSPPPVTSPGGAYGYIQYNNSGSFGGFGSWDGNTMTITGLTTSQTVGDPTGGGLIQDSSSGNLFAYGNFYDFLVYAYYTTGGVTVYSANPLDLNATDNGDTNPFRWQLSWSAAPGPVTGYIVIVVEDDYNGYYSPSGFDVGNVTSTNYDGSQITGSMTTTPTSPYIVYDPTIPAIQSNGNINVVGKINDYDIDGDFSTWKTLHNGGAPYSYLSLSGYEIGIAAGLNPYQQGGFNGVLMANPSGNLFDFAMTVTNGFGTLNVNGNHYWTESVRLESRPSYVTTGAPELQFGSMSNYLGGFGYEPNMFLGGTMNAFPEGLTIGHGYTGQGDNTPAPPTHGLYVIGNIKNDVLTASSIVSTDSSKQLNSVSVTGSGSVVESISPSITTPNITTNENINNSGTSKNCATSGTVTWYPVEMGTGWKKVVGYANACLGASASYSFPTAFAHTPAVLTTNELGSALLSTLSTTAVVMTGTTSTGYIFIEGN